MNITKLKLIAIQDIKITVTIGRIKKPILVIMTSITLLALVIGLSSVPDAMAGVPVPETIIVDEDGEVASDPSIPATTEDCDGEGNTDVETTINDAIDEAGNGDTIIVCPGTYNESVEVDDSENVTIKGITKPLVDGSSNGDSPAFVITEDGTHVTGFEAFSDDDDCILVNGADRRRSKTMGDFSTGPGGHNTKRRSSVDV